jgi:hypothetical protein
VGVAATLKIKVGWLRGRPPLKIKVGWVGGHFENQSAGGGAVAATLKIKVR